MGELFDDVARTLATTPSRRKAFRTDVGASGWRGVRRIAAGDDPGRKLHPAQRGVRADSAVPTVDGGQLRLLRLQTRPAGSGTACQAGQCNDAGVCCQGGQHPCNTSQGPVCCAANTQCQNSQCVPRGSGGGGCPPGQALCGGSCCPPATCLNGKCCSNGHTVCGSGNKAVCCAPNEQCCGDHCCPRGGSCCGSTCCPAGTKCRSDGTCASSQPGSPPPQGGGGQGGVACPGVPGGSCPPGSACCGSTCCSGQGPSSPGRCANAATSTCG